MNQKDLEAIIEDLKNIKQIVDYRLSQLSSYEKSANNNSFIHDISAQKNNIAKEIEEKRKQIVEEANRIKAEVLRSAEQAKIGAEGYTMPPQMSVPSMYPGAHTTPNISKLTEKKDK